MLTVTDNLTIYHTANNKVLLAKCNITGKFVKNSVAMSVLAKLAVDKMDTILVLLSCILVNIVAMLVIAI